MDKLNGLTRNTKEKFLYLSNKAKELYDYDIFVTTGYRTAEHQNRLYQQGRTTPWAIVTHFDWYNTRSSHQYGISFDIAFRWSELYPEDHTKWENIAKIARKINLQRWYDMRIRDKPHFENQGDLPLKYFISNNWEVATMHGKRKVQLYDKKITVSIQNKTSDIHDIKHQILIRSIIRNIQRHIKTPIERIEDEKKASIMIFYVEPWDSRLPVDFPDPRRSLWYWLAPWIAWASWKVFINDNHDWSNIEKRRLRIVLEHEILHCMNIWHSLDEKSIMYKMYSRWEHYDTYTEWVIDLLQKLYWNPKKHSERK